MGVKCGPCELCSVRTENSSLKTWLRSDAHCHNINGMKMHSMLHVTALKKRRLDVLSKFVHQPITTSAQYLYLIALHVSSIFEH